MAGCFGVGLACLVECDASSAIRSRKHKRRRVELYAVGGVNDYALSCVDGELGYANNFIESETQCVCRCASQYVIGGSGGYILICVKRTVVLMAGWVMCGDLL